MKIDFNKEGPLFRWSRLLLFRLRFWLPEIRMKIDFNKKGPLFRWSRLLLFSAPLLASCASASSEPVASGAVVASNDSEAAKDADMKDVILHVFGMT